MSRKLADPPAGHLPDFLPLGQGGWLSLRRVVAFGRYDSAPVRRAARQARSEGRLIDLTYGQAAVWVCFMDSGQVILAPEMTILGA